MEIHSNEKKMDFKDLEQLLQHCYNNKDLQVVDYTATKLLPAGENFGSIMVKLDAKIRTNKHGKEEMLYLVGKTPSRPDKPMTEWPLIFQKERFMYMELFPVYRDLEREIGIDEKELIDVLPHFIGYRNSLKDKDEADDDSVLLMENLKIKGYYIANKSIGMDVHHARKALTSLARYQALSIVMKQRRPSVAEKAIEQADILGIDFSHLDHAYASACDILIKIPTLKQFSAIIQSSFEQGKDGASWKDKPTEPWATINHGDFWTNNMLFHKNSKGNVDDVKFVDFQTYIYSSPLKDVSRLLGCSVDRDTQTNHLKELLNLYYDTFVKTLKRMGHDVSLFTKESFDREVKGQAIKEFPLCVLSQKFFCSEIIDDNKSNEENIENIINDKPSEAFIDRMIWLVEVYRRMKWF